MSKKNGATERESGYVEGRRRTLLTILDHTMRELHGLGGVPETATILVERQEVIATLRRLCAEHGDNDWPENLHLSDVIEKHLVKPFRARD